MPRRDVSFRFIDRVWEIERNISDERWQSALALALTLPDILGGIAYPEVVRRYRDGRIMLDKQKKPTRDVGSQYIRWFDDYAALFFKQNEADADPYICGERCWQLRCEYLHQNKGFINDPAEQEVHFHLGVNCGSSVCEFDKSETEDEVLNIRIDIEQFCIRMCRAARSYYEEFAEIKDFNLYNTPVLDFLSWEKEEPKENEIVLIAGNVRYRKALMSVLSEFSVLDFADAAEALRAKRPLLYIITDEVLLQKEFLRDNRAKVLLLKGNAAVEKTNRITKTVRMPFSPEELRSAVRSLLPERSRL